MPTKIGDDWYALYTDYAVRRQPAGSKSLSVMCHRSIVNTATRVEGVPSLPTWTLVGRKDWTPRGYATYGIHGAGLYGGPSGWNGMRGVWGGYSFEPPGSMSWTATDAQRYSGATDWGYGLSISAAPSINSDEAGWRSTAAKLHVLDIPTDSVTAATAQMTSTWATTSAKATTVTWLDDNQDKWWWANTLADTTEMVHPMLIATSDSYCFPYDATGYDWTHAAGAQVDCLGAQVIQVRRAAASYPAWIKWRTRLDGFNRGDSNKTLPLNPWKLTNGTLSLRCGWSRANASYVYMFFRYLELDGTPVTSTAQIKAQCGINKTVTYSEYGISGLGAEGGFAGETTWMDFGPGTNWYGKYPAADITPPAGVSTNKGFRLQVIAWDVDNGSVGTMPDRATTTFASVEAMLAAGFVTVADVEFHPESATGPVIDGVVEPHISVRVDHRATVKLKTSKIISIDGGAP